jgi:hypothetical protein
MIGAPLALSTTTWIAIGSVGTFIAATATTVLALVTRGIADKTGSLAEETRRLAAATEDDVSANWRPLVICPGALTIPANEGDFPIPGGGTQRMREFETIRVSLANVGRGPAVNVRVTAESRAIANRIATPSIAAGVLPAGSTIKVDFPGHLVRDPGQRELAYKITVHYADIAQHVFETDMRFLDPLPGITHNDERLAVLVSLNVRPANEVTLSPSSDSWDDPDNLPAALRPQSHDRPRVTGEAA